MVESETTVKLDLVREEIREALKGFYEKLGASLRDNLKSITVVGSSVTADFQPGKSDINTVIALGKQDLASLNVLAGMAKSMSKKKVSAPLIMTADYIERSRDVFGIELLDFQLAHATVFGDDPFVSLTFDKGDVRLQCERELKAALIRLRQGYIAAAANKKLVRDILISTVSGLAPLLRAMLWLVDSDRPKEAEATFAKAAEQFSLNADVLIRVRKWRHEKARTSETEIVSAFESIYSAVDQLAGAVDKLEV